jgi:hypothetical protein
VTPARTLLLGLRLFAPPDAAEVPTPDPEIEWHAPPDCVTRDELVARTEALLGRPLGQPGDPELALRGEIVEAAPDLLLRLEFRRPVERVRELRGGSCVELRDAAAMVLAVTVDPLTSLAEPEPEPEPEPAPEPEPEPEPAPEPEPEPEPEAEPTPTPEPTRASELGGLVRLGGGVVYPLLPSLGGGPSLAVGLRWRALRAELVGALWLGPAARMKDTPEVGATIIAGWVAPRLCGVPRAGRVEFPLCAGLELGGMRGTAFGVPDASSSTLAWVAIETGGAASVGLGRALALWIGADLVVPLTRPGFSIAGLGQLHRAPPVGFAALLGLEAQFGKRE